MAASVTANMKYENRRQTTSKKIKGLLITVLHEERTPYPAPVSIWTEQ